MTFENVTVVIGPPCSGKTTFVERLRRPGDLVIDYDRLAVALGSTTDHNHGEHLIQYVVEARDAVVALLAKSPSPRSWIVLTTAQQALRMGLPPARWHVMDTPAATCRARAIAVGRPPETLAAIDQWEDTGRSSAAAAYAKRDAPEWQPIKRRFREPHPGII